MTAVTVPRTADTNLKKLGTILDQLEFPLMIRNKEREKYANAYAVFKFYISKMCVELDLKNYGIDPQSNDYYPCYDPEKVGTIDDLPNRLIYERFDDVWMDRTKRVPPETRIDRSVTPKPQNLEQIPPDNITKIYKTYFGGASTADNKSRKSDKKEKDTGSKKSSPTKTKAGLVNVSIY